MSRPPLSVGVLALQGDFERHLAALRRAGAEAREVRTAADLAGLDGLVIPGGESTTMLKLIEGDPLEAALGDFIDRGGAVFGTCAGLILLAREVLQPPQRSLGRLDVVVERNAYGRQTNSFEATVAVEGVGDVRGVFIRAPRIASVGDAVEVLATHGGDPVVVRQGRILGASFHPELTDDDRLLRSFLDLLRTAR